MLNPRLGRPDELAQLQGRFAATRRLRIEAAFPEARAAAWLTALRGSEHEAYQRVDPDAGFQVWRFGFEPGVGCEHPLCELGRWLRADGVAWVAALTGLSLGAEPNPMLLSDKACKAAFRDGYDARAEAPGRVIGFAVHLTPGPWPVEWGGHLELHDGDVVERFGPAWNTLDLFDLSAPGQGRRRLPMIDRHVEGYTITGGFHASS